MADVSPVVSEPPVTFETPREPVGGTDAYGFPQALKVGGTIYVGCRSGAAEGEGIREQTAGAFQGMVDMLEAGGGAMSDLINLRTYYLYDGEPGPEETRYWEDMTEVRLRYLADPGPAATAVRVAGVPGRGDLIGIDGIGVSGTPKQKLMPADFWDWSMPVPFVQGWRLPEVLYLGGQISADDKGRAVGVGDIEGQTRNTLDFIHRVLLEGGLDWPDLATMRVCYQHTGDKAAAKACLETVLSVVEETLPAPLPALTCFGVDLLYEGLVLEIDGVAPAGPRTAITPPGLDNWVRYEDFPTAFRAGGHVYVGGISAPGGASLTAQAEASLDRMAVTLTAAESSLAHLVKLTVFYVPATPDAPAEADIAAIAGALGDYLPEPGPVVTILRVNGLPFDGQRLQLDGVAID